jgi:Transglycosylase SLT domain
MRSGSHSHVVAVGARRTGGRRVTVAAVRRRARSWKRTFRALLAAVRTFPITAQLLMIVAAILLAALAANWAYHAVRKPTEVFFPLTNALDKQPFETWREYGLLFQNHATAVITPDLLAALAQVESAGNPVARTYWRWRPTWNPLELYRPASSAVGMFQITDATFQEGKRYCIHDHRVVQDGRWNDVQACWFNSLYSRVLPSHAIELTAALLDHAVENAIRQSRRVRPTLRHKQDLAAVIHLCGVGAGQTYVARGFRLGPHQRCGDHSARSYLDRVHDMQRKFARLAAGESLLRYVRPQ